MKAKNSPLQNENFKKKRKKINHWDSTQLWIIKVEKYFLFKKNMGERELVVSMHMLKSFWNYAFTENIQIRDQRIAGRLRVSGLI